MTYWNSVQHFPNGLIKLRANKFADQRGHIVVASNDELLKGHIGAHGFIQDNFSFNFKSVFRGIHLQRPPFEQAKLITLISGSICDYVIDLRPNSCFFGEKMEFILDARDGDQLFIPGGFGHGFLSLEDHTIVHYKVNQGYNPHHEITLSAESVGIHFESLQVNPIMSDKDRNGLSLNQLREVFFS